MTLPPAAPQRQLKHRRHTDVQAFARGNGLREVDAVLTDGQPFQIDRCHALRSDGAQVRAHHPRCYRPAKAA
jgi:hypothetical protein